MSKLLALIIVSAFSVSAGQAFGQPRPYDSTPLDFVPRAEQEIPAPQPQSQLQSPPTQAPPVLVNPSAPSATITSPTIMSPTIMGPTSDIPPQPEFSPNAEKWRYTWFSGRWWYRQPNNRWSYFSDGRWVDYAPPGRTNASPYILPPPPVRRWQFGAGRYYRNPYPPGVAAPYGGPAYPPGGY
jgi:hypothetical protein